MTDRKKAKLILGDIKNSSRKAGLKRILKWYCDLIYECLDWLEEQF